MAVLRPVGRRPRWIGREEFIQQVLSHRADPALATELVELAPDTTDDLAWRVGA